MTVTECRRPSLAYKSCGLLGAEFNLGKFSSKPRSVRNSWACDAQVSICRVDGLSSRMSRVWTASQHSLRKNWGLMTTNQVVATGRVIRMLACFAGGASGNLLASEKFLPPAPIYGNGEPLPHPTTFQAKPSDQRLLPFDCLARRQRQGHGSCNLNMGSFYPSA